MRPIRFTEFINVENCFKTPRFDKTIDISQCEISSNWQAELAEFLGSHANFGRSRQQPIDFVKSELNRHIGEGSNYQHRAELTRQLQIIYAIVTDSFVDKDNPPIKLRSDDEKATIACRLTEDMDACTNGFHNRAIQIVQSLSLSHDIDDLLAQIRREMVEQQANSMTQEIHTYNRFFVIANAMGLGVKSINDRDGFDGELTDQQIRRSLRKRFEKDFRPFFILLSSYKLLQSKLYNMGYQGSKPEGYDYGLAMDFGKFLQSILYDKHQQCSETSFLQLDYVQGIITDIDWLTVSRQLWLVLNRQQYVDLTQAQYQAFSNCLADGPLLEHDCLNVASCITSNEEVNSIMALEHIAIEKRLMLWAEFQKQQGHERLEAVEVFCRHINDNVDNNELSFQQNTVVDTTKAFSELLSFNDHTGLVLVLQGLRSFSELAQQQVLTSIADNHHTVFSSLLEKGHYEIAKNLLNIIDPMSQQRRDSLMLSAFTESRNICHSVRLSNEHALIKLLSIIKDLSPHVKVTLLRKKADNGDNLLHRALSANPTVIPAILSTVNSLDYDNYAALLTEQDGFSHNPLMKAAIVDKHAYKYLMRACKKYLNQQDFKKIIAQRDSNNYNLLHLALMGRLAATELLKRAHQIDVSCLRDMLAATDSNGFNSLMHVMKQKHFSLVKPILDHLTKLPVDDQLSIWTKRLYINLNTRPDESPCSLSALDYMFAEMPKAVGHVLNAIGDMDQQQQITVLSTIGDPGKLFWCAYNEDKPEAIKTFFNILTRMNDDRLNDLFKDINYRFLNYIIDGKDRFGLEWQTQVLNYFSNILSRLNHQMVLYHLNYQKNERAGDQQVNDDVPEEEPDNNDLPNYLLAAIRKGVDPDWLIQVLQKLPSSERGELLTQFDRYTGNNILMSWLFKGSNVELLPQLLDDLDDKVKKSVITQYNKLNMNALSIALNNNSRAVSYLISLMYHLANEDKYSLLQRTDYYGDNLLLQAMANWPEHIPLLFLLVNNLDHHQKRQLLWHTAHSPKFIQTGQNTLLTVLQQQNRLATYFLALVRDLEQADQYEILSSVDQDNCHPLMRALISCPVAFNELTQILRGLDAEQQSHILQIRTTMSGKRHCNVLMMALELGDSYTQQLLPLLRQLDSRQLDSIVNAADSNGETALDRPMAKNVGLDALVDDKRQTSPKRRSPNRQASPNRQSPKRNNTSPQRRHSPSKQRTGDNRFSIFNRQVFDLRCDESVDNMGLHKSDDKDHKRKRFTIQQGSSKQAKPNQESSDHSNRP